MANVTVHALDAGHITLPERFFVSPADGNASQSVPSMSFLIQHQSPTSDQTTRIVFDLGLRRDLSLYPPALEKHCANRAPISTKPDVVESLARGGLTPDDIDFVILSHVHYDHIGYPQDFGNPRTKFLVGPGSSDLLDGTIKLHGSHSVFEPDMFPSDRLIELVLPSSSNETTQNKGSDISEGTKSTTPAPSVQSSPINLNTWTSLPPFPHALDLFSDSSVYILSAPGHIPGHINLLIRSSSSSPSNSPAQDILLAGDACHDIRLLNGTHEIATWIDDHGNQCCIHADIPQATETIQRLRHVHLNGLDVVGADNYRHNDDEKTNNNEKNQISAKTNVEVVFAHNWEWEIDAKNRGRFWPGQL